MQGIAEKFITVGAAGGSYAIPASDMFSQYLFTSVSTATLVAPYTVTAATPTKTTQYNLFYDAHLITSGANVVSFFGTTLNAQQALQGKINIIATYQFSNPIGWKVAIIPGTGDSDAIVMPVSFESGNQSANKWIAPCAGIFTRIDSCVTKQLAGTDAGTITPQINATSVTNGLISIPASSAVNVLSNNTPTALNVFKQDDVISVISAKVTPGGAALVTLRFLRTP